MQFPSFFQCLLTEDKFSESRTSEDSTIKLYPLFALLGLLVCPVWCLIAYCCRRKAPPKPNPVTTIEWLPAPKQEVIYEPPPPVQIEEIYVPASNLCPVFIPDDYHRMPEEGSEQMDIFEHPGVPHGFLNFDDYDNLSRTGIQIPLPLPHQTFQAASVAPWAISDLTFSSVGSK
jgi:hypothetical protein